MTEPNAASREALIREAASLVYRIEAAGAMQHEGANFQRWKADARRIAPDLRLALSDEAASQPREGWRLVPVEPTEAMQRAFVDLALHGDVLSHGGWMGYARDQWSAMLAAAPALDTAPTDQAQGGRRRTLTEQIQGRFAALAQSTPTDGGTI